MDKRELQELLSQSYKQENWKKIVSFVFPNVSILSTPKEFPISNDKIKTFRQLGNVRLNDGKNLALFELLLSDTVNIQRNRVELNNEISKYIDQEQIHGVLSVFEQGTDDYRFTFSARSTEFDEQESDFVQKKTDTKRYTYVLGKNESCKTPAERFYKLSEKKSEVDINAIQNAFSVEQLSKEFFEKYKKQFEKFWKYIHTNEAYNSISFGTDREKGIRDFTKKLLGRIVFLHFLQKKGWMGCTAKIKGWEDGDKQFMQTLFENYSNQSEFHSKCLAELFYNTLNKRRTDDIFVCDGLEGVLSKSKVPYLNGGLFDSDENITRKIDFPASYFQELFDFFGQYNFTIDENDPNDHEVGIDPEMLGHIFENLLEDNKDKGAFYTPKVIVQYMCQESIIEYINTKINESESPEIKSAIEDLIRNKLAEKCSDLDLVQPISKALFEVKVCDPAIGSGAFPMGILNVIYSAIEELYFIQPDSVASIWGVSDIEWQPHLVKKNIIQHSIYGVDLESGAVDIARLRFWLALVVDEIEPLPLPNLDYKIMQGNSLLESFEGIDLSKFGDAKAYESIKDEKSQIDLFTGKVKSSSKISTTDYEDIKALMDEYFNSNTISNKKEIHSKIDNQVINHIHLKIDEHKKELSFLKENLEKNVRIVSDKKLQKKLSDTTLELSILIEKEIKLSQLVNSNERPFFLWHLFFKEVFDEGGFDIVIGNPPYVQLQKMGTETDILESIGYKTFVRTGDIYCLFYELGIDLLKNGGLISYITSNSWLKTKYGTSLRQFLIEKSNPVKLLNFEDTQIFPSATVEVNILISNKKEWSSNLTGVAIKDDYKKNNSIQNYIDKNKVIISQLDESEWIILSKDDFIIKTRIEKNNRSLKEYGYKIISGVKTGLNEAFLIDKNKMNEFIKMDSKYNEIIKPIIRGRDISKYATTFNEIYCIFSHNGNQSLGYEPVDIETDYPLVYEYLCGFGDKIKSRPSQGKNWWNVPTNWLKESTMDRIIWGELSDKPKFSFENNNSLTEATVFNLTGENLKSLLLVLNSNLCHWYFETFTTTSGMGTNRWKKYKMEKIPLPKMLDKEAVRLNILSDYLIYLNNPKSKQLLDNESNEEVSNLFEKIANLAVYELYFSEEIKDADIDVINLIDFKDISFETDEEKVKTILNTYYDLLGKNNEIRNRVLVSESRCEFIKVINNFSN